MFFYDSVANAEAQSRSLTDLLGSEEGIKDAVRVFNAVAVVAEGNFDDVIPAGGPDLDARSSSSFAHRVVGIVQNVQKDLLQLLGVARSVKVAKVSERMVEQEAA